MEAGFEIFKSRLRSCANLLKKHNFQAMIVTPGTDFFYLTGLSIGVSERLIAFLFLPSGKQVLIGPAFEIDRLKTNRVGAPIKLWQESENPYKIAAEIIKSPGRAGKVAIEPTAEFRIYDAFKKELPAVKFESAAEIFEPMRISKSVFESAAIIKAASRTLKRMKDALNYLKPGISELEALEKFGGGGMVQFGPTSAVPHAHSGKRRLRKDDVVIIDACDIEDGYYSDITRTIFVGKPTSKMIRIYDIVKEAQTAAIERIAPGVLCEEVDFAAREVIERAGYGEKFIHRTGHGLGLNIHERPYLVKGNKERLMPGAVVTVEPGIYLPGEFGVRLEDDVIVTDRGCKLLSKRIEEMPVI